MLIIIIIKDFQTINYTFSNSEHEPDYVTNKMRTARVNIALLNSIGVGNSNACIVMKKFMDI
ncbi:hypothetical protein HZA55_02625 [Candidatus Poribacteria bacterium]|nr:hypothetical protein [Candidatus Poribacteria bacterium]